MPSVDDRVVAMKFDNAAFEQKIASTIASLDKLKGSLDFANSRKGMDELSTASKHFSLEGIAQAVDGIGSHFTAMGAIAFTVLQNIANRAIDAGINIVKSLSLDQVLSGFQEYETNMNSIQTILANTRSDNTTLQDVNKALDELNHYSDQTIYNFSQMTRNIGTFTAAGVDLKTSTAAIKGIANLAAVSGSSADQASVAMYQLSQALASGTVKLMDWNSVVNAGMGGEVFQKALFETGKSLGTLKNVKLDETFDQWKAAGNSFRGSLEDGWITADVLTNTLQGFTGDLTAEQIKALGYTDEQTKNILEMGKVAQDAATKVKTFSQLLNTTKEAVGSQWSETFRIVFGTFDEARNTFTNFSNSLNEVIQKSGEQRNAMLQNWKDLGGREVLIDGITQAFKALAGILKPIKDAFHDVFPPITVVTLNKLTHAFRNLMERLTPTPAVTVLIQRTFRGLFTALDIGIDVVKGVIKFFGNLFDLFNKSNDPNKGILGFTAQIGDAIVIFKKHVDEAGGIVQWFDDLGKKVADFLDNFSLDKAVEVFQGFVQKAKDAIASLFGGGPGSTEDPTEKPNLLDAALQRLGDRFGWIQGLGETLSSTWDKIKGHFDDIQAGLQGFLDFVKNTFSGLPQAVADAVADTDYNQALDTINTGLFGGLVVMFHKFISGNGGTFSGVFKNISGAFNELTGVLQTMQNNIKADTLVKIATAVGVLTGAVLVLSLLNSGALTKSLAAISIGFGQLVTVMALLDKVVSGPGAAAKLTLLAAGLVALGASMIVFAVAAKVFATMNWEELAKGLTAVAVLLTAISIAVKPLSANSKGMITAGLGIIAIATALNILALAVKSFAEMNWEGMAQGLTGVAAGLTAITIAMNFIPDGMVAKGLGLIAVATALNIMALAVKSFAQMDWASMGKGMAGVAASLLILAGALQLMPNGASLALQGVGLALIGAGLLSMSKAITSLSKLSWKEMAKGLVGIAGTLVVLAAAGHVMEGSIGGAVAITIMAFSLSKIAKAIKEFSKLSWGELGKGIAALGVSLAALAAAALLMTPVIPELFLLGAALLLVGGAFALFGVGANLVATAFGILATAGTQGIATLVSALDVLIEHLPAIIAALGDGMIQLAGKILEALPGFISNMDEVIQSLLQLIIDNIPKMVETFVALIQGGLQALRDTAPDIIATGLELLLDLLKGISDNIGEVTATVISIITNFLNEVANHAGEIVTAGLNILTQLLQGIGDNIDDVVSAVAGIITSFIGAIDDATIDIIVAGTKMVTDFIKGIGDAALSVADAGTDTLIKFLNGIADDSIKIANAALDVIVKFINGIADAIDSHTDDFRNAGIHMAEAIANGMTFGLAGKVGDVAGGALNMGKSVAKKIGGFFGIGSPSKLMMKYGGWIGDGLAIGMTRNDSAAQSALEMAGNVVSTVQDALSNLPTDLEGMDQFNPTITPVLDLSQVKSKVKEIGGIVGPIPDIQSTLSIKQANIISTESIARQQDQAASDQFDTSHSTVTREIKFEQNNYSPKALTTAEIYRNTRNQIAMAKEELAVL